VPERPLLVLQLLPRGRGTCLSGHCSFFNFCRAGGDICETNADCCDGGCDPTTHKCDLLTSCVPTNEPCTGLRSCCDTLCVADGFGSSLCYPMCGCRPYDDVCTANFECCSNECGTPDADGVRRCSKTGLSCVPDGDVCGGNGASQNCCNGGKNSCVKTSDGVNRCLPTVGGACYPTGHACALCDECCSHLCVPQAVDGGMALVCGSSCIPIGSGTCTADSDCCAGGVCQDGICAQSGSQCSPLGGACVQSSDCCQGICVGGSCSAG
jgi:hypothetical protein